jgi:SAM-dependent methyltransferase
MRQDAQKIEDGRLQGVDLNNYQWYNERHRIFPQILSMSGAGYRRILDVAAGVGIVGKRIKDGYPCTMVCNDIASESLRNLRANGLTAVAFDLDTAATAFPFPDGSFDAVISLATLEHIIQLDNHINEIRRVLAKNGHLYLSTPNYSAIHFMIPFVLGGRTFHDPMKGGLNKYEFYAHVRYFTYKSLVEFMRHFGFSPDIAYIPLPKESSKFRNLKKRSPLIALGFRTAMLMLYLLLPPRWAFHPVLRFTRSDANPESLPKWPKKVIV